MATSPNCSRLRPALSTLALATVLAGCASTHGLSAHGHAISADDLAAQRSLASFSLSDANFPRSDWWSTLGDPQLGDLISEALKGAPSLDAADARLRQAQAQAGLADAARKPSLTGSAQYSGVQLPETMVEPPLGGQVQGSNLLMLNFSYGLDLWGGKRAQWEAAVGQVRASEVDAQAARLTLSSSIARTYVSLAEAFAARDVAQTEEKRATTLLDLSRQRVEAGLDNQMQLRQAESTIASARQQAEAAQQRIDAARTAIAALMGQGPDRGLAIERPRLLQASPATLPSVVPSELLGHRPDVVAARWRVEAASRGIDASNAAFKPSINLSLIAGLVSPNLSDLFSSDALVGLGGPALSLPIFDGGHLRSQLGSSNASYDLAVANYNQSLIGALREVSDALQASRSLEAQLLLVGQAHDAAFAAWTLASDRYRAGLGTQLDVLSAQRPLLQLDQQIAGLRAQRINASIDLDRALGGGLDLTADASSPSTAVTP